MSDKLAGGIKAGSTDVSLMVLLRSTTDNTEVTGKTYTDFNVSYWRQGGTRTAVTEASLGTVDAAHSDGGIIEVDSTNMPGLYRLDMPDASFATGADWVVISAVVSGAYAFVERYALESQNSKDIYDRIGAPVGASIAADLVTIDNFVDELESRLTAARAGYLDNLSAGAVAQASVCTEGRLSELDAANIPADVDAILTDTGTTLETHLTDIKGATFNGTTDSLEAIRNQGDSAWITATGFSTHSAADVRTEIDNNSTQLTAIVGDTNELQTDWVNGGRLDLLIDAIKAKTDNLKDSWNDLSAAQVNSEVDTALADIHLDHLLAVDTGASLPGAAGAIFQDLLEDDGGTWRYSANALEQAPTGGTNPNVLVSTTISSVTSQTEFVLTAGSNDDDAYNNQSIVLYDASDSDYPSVRKVSNYVGSTKTVTIDSAPDFTIVNGDGVKVFVTAPGTTAPTAAEIADAVWDEAKSGHVSAGTFGKSVADIEDDTGTSGVQVADKSGYSLAADQSGVTVGTVNALGTQAKADVNAEVDNAFDTAIPGTPTANSINERIKAIDDKLPAGTISDFDESTDNVTVGTNNDKTGYGLAADQSGVTVGTVNALGTQAKLDVNAQCDTALADYDAPTKAEMDAGFAALNDPSAASVADAVWDEAISGHVTAGTFGAKNQKVVPSETVNDYKADVSGLATASALATVDTVVDAIKAKTDALPSGITKGVELANFQFFMVLSSDHVSAATGKTVTGEISKDGGAFAAVTNSITEVGNGLYKVTLTATEMNADAITLKFTEASCDQRMITVYTS